MTRPAPCPLDQPARARITRQIDQLGHLITQITPGILQELAQRLADAQHWIAAGYPTGTSSSGGSRSADRSSSTERAVIAHDTTSRDVANIVDHIDQATTALGDLLYDLAWLRPTTADPAAPMKVAHCIDCTRLVSGLPDVKNRDGAIIRTGDPIKAGRCRDCHAKLIAARRTTHDDRGPNGQFIPATT